MYTVLMSIAILTLIYSIWLVIQSGPSSLSDDADWNKLCGGGILFVFSVLAVIVAQGTL